MSLLSRLMGAFSNKEELKIPVSGLTKTEVESLFIDPESVVEVRILVRREGTNSGHLTDRFAGDLYGMLNTEMWKVMQDCDWIPTFRWILSSEPDLDEAGAAMAVEAAKDEPELSSTLQGLGKIGYATEEPGWPREANLLTMYRGGQVGDYRRVLAIANEKIFPSRGEHFDIQVRDE